MVRPPEESVRSFVIVSKAGIPNRESNDLDFGGIVEVVAMFEGYEFVSFCEVAEVLRFPEVTAA
jgi:hypothetical protein